MIVCDICGKPGNVKTYHFPMRSVWYKEYMGKRVGSFIKYEDKDIDLCRVCAETIADLVDHLQAAHREKE